MTLKDKKFAVGKRYGFTSDKAREFYSLCRKYQKSSSIYYKPMMAMYRELMEG